MKRFTSKGMLLVIAIFLTIPAVKAQDTLRINLNQALEIAMNESPTIMVADKEIQKKIYAKKETVSQLFPTVDANASWSHSIKKMSFAMQGQVFEAGSKNSWQGGFNLALPVFAPALYKSIQLSGMDVEMALELARSSRLDMVNQVTIAYYQLLLAQDSYNVLLQSYKQAQATLEVTTSKFNQGVVSEYDKIRAEVQVYNLKPSVVSAENAINLTRMQLQVLMGLDVSQPVAVEGNLSDYERDMYADVLEVDTSLVNNSDLKQMDVQRQMVQKTLKLNKTAFMPTLAFTTQWSWQSMAEDFKFKDYNWRPYATLGLTLAIPLVHVSDIFKVKQSKLDIDQINYNAVNLHRNVTLQVRNYMDNIQKSVEQIGSNKEGVKQAEKGRTIAQKRYEVGAGTILEVNDSEVALTQSRLSYNQSIYDYLTSKADLDKVLGKDHVIMKPKRN